MDEVRMDMIGRRFFADYSWGEMCELLESPSRMKVKLTLSWTQMIILIIFFTGLDRIAALALGLAAIIGG